MSKPQQPELRRTGYGATDDDSAKFRADQAGEETGDAGPIPEANRPGHHPESEQDKPDVRP